MNEPNNTFWIKTVKSPNNTFYTPNSAIKTYPFDVRLYTETNILILEEKYLDSHACMQFSVEFVHEAEFILKYAIDLFTVMGD